MNGRIICRTNKFDFEIVEEIFVVHDFAVFFFILQNN